MSTKQPNSQLINARVQRLWTIKIAAAKVGVSETTYIRWEQGQQQPQLLNLKQLRDAFEVPPEKLGYGNSSVEELKEYRPSLPAFYPAEMTTREFDLYKKIDRLQREQDILTSELQGLYTQLELERTRRTRRKERDTREYQLTLEQALIQTRETAQRQIDQIGQMAQVAEVKVAPTAVTPMVVTPTAPTGHINITTSRPILVTDGRGGYERQDS